MRDWLNETIDQIALGELLANSRLSCGQRFGLIAVDNAVEFMLIAYVELKKQIVGGHKQGGIPQKDWDSTKRAFPNLLGFVASKEPKIRSMEDELNRYHDTRSSLYHSGKPITVNPSYVIKYSKHARGVLDILFDISITLDEWDQTLSRVATSLIGNSVTKSIKRTVSFAKEDELVRFTTSELPSKKESVALCLYAYQTATASTPSRLQLIKSLIKSGCAIGPNELDARLSDLRREGWVNKDSLELKQKGIKKLSEKYLLSS